MAPTDLTASSAVRFRKLPRASSSSIKEFCARWRITENTFRNWGKAGVAPEVTQPFPRAHASITAEAEAAWVRQRSRSQTTADRPGLGVACTPAICGF